MRAVEPRQGNSHRQRLLEALADSIRQRGLRATQIADIVRLARTSRRTFYECFPDKESCFVELVREATTMLLAAITAAVDPDAAWDVQIEQAVDTYLAALADDPAMTATISRELPALGLRGADVQREGIERYAEMMVQLAEAAERRGSGGRIPSLEMAVMLVGGLNELIIHAYEHGQPVAIVAPVAKDVMKSALAPRA